MEQKPEMKLNQKTNWIIILSKAISLDHMHAKKPFPTIEGIRIERI